MYAAVVRSFDGPPRYEEIPTPLPQTDDEILVDVVAAGLHPRVRSQADGSHYTSSDELPLVPGIDGVGRTPDGTLRYFILPDTTLGAMAEQTIIDLRRSIVLPEDSDPIAMAAAINPAMSSWVALRQRITFEPGQSVLILGATGNAGRMAVQVAKELGAGCIIGAARRADRLPALLDLGADATIALQGPDVAERLGSAARQVDVVIDYLWGRPAADALVALAMHRADPRRPLTWIQIGSVAGAAADIPSAALRAVRVQIVGSGQGSVSAREIRSELDELARFVNSGTLRVSPRAVPLKDVAAAWADDQGSDDRIVITP